MCVSSSVFGTHDLLGSKVQRKVHGMPSEFSLEFGSAMLMVRPQKMMSWYSYATQKGEVWKIIDSKVPTKAGR